MKDRMLEGKRYQRNYQNEKKKRKHVRELLT